MPYIFFSKMFYIILPILVALAATSSPVNDYRQIEISDGQELLFQSPGYPHAAPVGTRISWDVMIRDTKNSRVVITCHDIRIEHSKNCNLGYFSVFDGKEETKQCETLQEFVVMSENYFTRITFDLTFAIGVCSCRIYTVGTNNGDQTMSPNEKQEDQLQEVTEPPGPLGVKLKEYVINLVAGEPPNKQLELGAIPVNTDYKWSFNTIPGHRISLFCQDYYFENCHATKGYLLINDGKKKKKVCGPISRSFKTIAISTSNVLDLEYKSHPNNTKLSMKCIVQAITGEDEFEFRNIVSEEVDSTEHGRTAGLRSTSCNCGYSSKNRARIVNGKVAIDGEYPWMAGLYYVPWSIQVCGGSIITEYHVLTAVHCMHSDIPEDFYILVGSTANSAAQRLSVRRITKHEGFNGMLYNLHDITIMEVTKPIQFSKTIGPICLTKERLSIDNNYVTIMGWGVQGDAKILQPKGLLLKAHARVVDIVSCSYHWFGAFDIPGRNRLCIWSRRYGVCNGDSGGPIVWVDPETNRYTQIGINSQVRGCKSSYPSSSPFVPDYIDWILDVINATNQRGNICSKI